MQKDKLIELYCHQKLSLSEIAEVFKVSISTVRNYMIKYNITRRTPAEALATDLSNTTIGNWLVTDEKGYINNQKHLRWKCKCLLCNTYHWILARSLYTKTSKQCLQCRRNARKKGCKEILDSVWQQLIRSAKDRGWEVKITPEYALEIFKKQNEKCALTGLKLAFGYKSKTTASLDRIDPTKGYVEGNIQWLHKDVNRMKWKHSQQYFVDLCKKIALIFQE